MNSFKLIIVPMEHVVTLSDVDSMFPVMYAYGKRQNEVNKICFNENKDYCPAGYILVSVSFYSLCILRVEYYRSGSNEQNGDLPSLSP